MKTRINETEINRIVKKIVNEGLSNDKMMEILDDVANRLREHGISYYRRLNELNDEFPSDKYKRIPSLKRSDVELPKGVRVSKSTFPDEI